MHHMESADAFADYRINLGGDGCYVAGLPGYPRNFSRDALLAGILAAHEQIITNQLAISWKHQGDTLDPITGEEPGKIHHEYPGFPLREPYLTTYNACDTTALYLIAIELLGIINPSAQQLFIHSRPESIDRAITYILSHVRDDIFWEFPPAGAPQYSLRVTYWKDSIVPSQRAQEEPHYPAAFALAHFQAARGLLAATRLVNRPELMRLVERMYKQGIRSFIKPSGFCVVQDKSGSLEQASSDELHCLAYIPKDYLHLLPITAIWHRAEPLITTAGIACMPQAISNQLTDTYHGHVVWIFEQAFLHYACTKFGLPDLAHVTQRCIPHIGDGQELVSVEPLVAPLGNTHQLWSVAARKYFEAAVSLRTIGGL